MQSLIRSKSAGVTGGRGTAGAGPGRDLLYPEDPENPSGRKKKKKRKTRRPEGRRSQEAKAIATSKVAVNLPEFTGKDLSEFA